MFLKTGEIPFKDRFMEKFLKTNYHTHSTFCDGKVSAEEMVKAAIEKKLDILGFSSHSMFPFSSDWHLQSKEHENYVQEILRLKKLYENQIKIQLGFEADFIQGVCAPDFSRYADFHPDYLIGAVHFVPGKNGFIEADGDFTETREKIKTVFDNDRKKAVQAYFDFERTMIKNCNFTILAHPDLIRKQNSPSAPDIFFDKKETWYKDEIKLTADAIAKSGVCVEINTGGMARGYLDTPYPSAEFLALLHEKNVPITINSDAHAPDNLDYGFDDAISFAKKIGYSEIQYFIDGKMMCQKI